jgi:ribosomal protein S18 acetylase RimI-like enzyme
MTNPERIMEVAIRTMEIGHYPAVLDLWQATEGVGLSSADNPEAIAQFLDRNPGLSAVAVEGQRVVGAVLCGHDGRRGYIHHLAVHPAYRRGGLGRALVRHCLQQLRLAGIAKCHLFVFASNDSGRAFWRATGWTERQELIMMSTMTAGHVE